MAALELTNRGFRTVVVEARDRLGGRTWTRSFRGHAVELGGTWVHWWQPHVFAELSRYGIGLTEMPEAAAAMSIDGDGQHVADDDASSSALERAMAKFWSEANVDFGANIYDPAWGAGFEDLPVSQTVDACDLTAEERASLSGCLASLAKYSINGGTAALHAAIVADRDPTVVLSSPVSRSTYGGGSVEVELDVAFGPRADAIDLSDRGSVEKALHAMVPSAVLVDYLAHDWTNDPHSRGTWTFHDINQGPEVITESQRPLGNLILAGDATASGWNGFIDGAIESGLRAARQAHAILRVSNG